MAFNAKFSEELSKVLFLELSKENVKKLFNMDIDNSIYVPVRTYNIIDKVKFGEDLAKIPMSFFIEGMYYVLGADPSFRFSNEYVRILSTINDSDIFIKGKIGECVKSKKYNDAYIMLKGLAQIEETKDVYDKMIVLLETLRAQYSEYKNEELEIIETAEKRYNDYALPYLYECIIRKEENDYDKALFCINNYIAKGGKQTPEVTELKDSLKLVSDYEKGKEILNDDPTEALKLLIPLTNEFGNDATLYYYIAVAYRMLENYEKAIYYLNESMNIDSNIVEVVNEMGINYACIGDYDTAIVYLRKAFEVTKSVEICTNLIMCYVNKNDLKNAKIHLELAKKLNSEDEVVKEIDQYFLKNKI
ncbi:tetratricopeptide repeat protein [Clostridium fermenticellae]|uniref:Tetratricopeptide repeat protein n=1 Tax=Clostridium fermenticellae TaxID=2068654 RepID=A0A386H2M0_9CLOT|nr:tetratricopeptide repeat protein [Clostridium fermenticellae]AYD39795.1 tetratricopeptide repeat protein [Clostridium fermenticellae]